VTTLHRSLSHKDKCPQIRSSLRCLVTSTKSGRSSAAGLTSSQAGGHLTPTSYSSNFRLRTPAEQSRAKQSSSLLPATSQHGHSWHRAPLGPLATYLFNVKTFVFSYFRCSSFDKKGGVGLFYNWCSLTTPYSTRGHIKVGDICYTLFTKHKLTQSSTIYMDICQCRIVQQPMPQLI
jgi:hypothetical protein